MAQGELERVREELARAREEAAVARAEARRLEEHVRDLRALLEERAEELRRRDTLLLDLQRRLPELPASIAKDTPPVVVIEPDLVSVLEAVRRLEARLNERERQLDALFDRLRQYQERRPWWWRWLRR